MVGFSMRCTMREDFEEPEPARDIYAFSTKPNKSRVPLFAKTLQSADRIVLRVSEDYMQPDLQQDELGLRAHVEGVSCVPYYVMESRMPSHPPVQYNLEQRGKKQYEDLSMDARLGLESGIDFIAAVEKASGKTAFRQSLVDWWKHFYGAHAPAHAQEAIPRLEENNVITNFTTVWGAAIALMGDAEDQAKMLEFNPLKKCLIFRSVDRREPSTYKVHAQVPKDKLYEIASWAERGAGMKIAPVLARELRKEYMGGD